MQSPPKYRTMASMPKVISRLGIALGLGVLATIAMTIYPLAAIDRGNTAKITTVYRGNHGWYHARDYAFGLEWSNLSLMSTTLSTPLFDGELPSWGEPPPPPYPQTPQIPLYRLASLATGWPMRTMVFHWSVSSMTQSFPQQAERDDQNTSISNASEEVLGKRQSGGPYSSQVLWIGVVMNIAIYAAVVVGPIGLLLRFARYSAGKSGKSTSTSK